MSTQPLRIFLVEDSSVIRHRLTEAILQHGRIDVVGWADTEEEAVRALRETHCDVVVLDLQLRQGNGLGVLKTMRAAAGVARPLYVVFTNYDFPHYRAKSAALGADHFFDKAREHESLLRLLEDMAGAREHEQKRAAS